MDTSCWAASRLYGAVGGPTYDQPVPWPQLRRDRATSGRLAAIASTALLLFGCKDRDHSEPLAPPPPADAAQRSKPPEPPHDAVDLTLLDPGAEPRHELRYHLRPDSSETMELTLRYSAANRMQAAPERELTFPVMKLVFKIELGEALPDGRVRYDFELAQTGLSNTAGADQSLVATAGAALKKAEGLRGSATVDSRGLISEGDLDIPAGLDPGMRVMMESMRSSMEQLSSPLPAEPVGPGARWELRQVLVQGGVTLEQVTVFELAPPGEPGGEHEADQVVLRGELKQNADRQEVSLPGVERAELIELSATGSSHIELDLSRLSPRRGALALGSESRFELTAAGKTSGLVSKGSLDLKIAGK